MEKIRIRNLRDLLGWIGLWRLDYAKTVELLRLIRDKSDSIEYPLTPTNIRLLAGEKDLDAKFGYWQVLRALNDQESLKVGQALEKFNAGSGGGNLF